MLQRRVIVEFPVMYNKPNGPRSRFQTQQPKMAWRPVEKRLQGNVVVEVNELPLPVPKYSFKIGTAKVDDNGQIIDIQPFLNVYNVHDAADLLRAVGDKYIAVRDEKEDEMNKRQRFADEDMDGSPLRTEAPRRTRS